MVDGLQLEPCAGRLAQWGGALMAAVAGAFHPQAHHLPAGIIVPVATIEDRITASGFWIIRYTYQYEGTCAYMESGSGLAPPGLLGWPWARLYGIWNTYGGVGLPNIYIGTTTDLLTRFDPRRRASEELGLDQAVLASIHVFTATVTVLRPLAGAPPGGGVPVPVTFNAVTTLPGGGPAPGPPLGWPPLGGYAPGDTIQVGVANYPYELILQRLWHYAPPVGPGHTYTHAQPAVVVIGAGGVGVTIEETFGGGAWPCPWPAFTRFTEIGGGGVF